MKKEKTKKSFFAALNTIKFKIVFIVIFVIIGTDLICFFSTLPGMKNNIREITKNYMIDEATMVGECLDRTIAITSKEAVMTPEALDVVAAKVSVKGLSSSYTYIVSSDGTMMYHPTAEKIGNPVENAAVKQLLAEIANGNRPEPTVITYLFKGVNKYASYYIGENMDFIVVVTADEAEVVAAANKSENQGIIFATCVLIVFMVVAFLIIVYLINPIGKITKVISRMSEMDFRDDGTLKAIGKKGDENGIMARALLEMRSELVMVIQKISGQSTELFGASSNMNNSANETAESVDQVEKAINEIAQGATSQAQETQTATENVILMGNMIEETNTEVENLRNNARSMRDAGDKAIEILDELNDINKKTKEAINVIYEQTNTTNSSAMKIKEATDIITDIAEETNLLSLNASIEAARAGEQGRGFAVVASQIQKLAEQSNESARQIAQIINILISDSAKSVETMEEVKAVILKQNEYVTNTEASFADVKDGISKSIDGIRQIAAKTQQLDEARVKVVDVVQNLTAIAEENAASTEETSASAAEVGNTMGSVAEEAKHLKDIANELEDSVKIFVVD